MSFIRSTLVLKNGMNLYSIKYEVKDVLKYQADGTITILLNVPLTDSDGLSPQLRITLSRDLVQSLSNLQGLNSSDDSKSLE